MFTPCTPKPHVRPGRLPLMIAAVALLTVAGCGAREAALQATSAPTIAAPDRPSVTGRVATALHLKKKQPAMSWGDENPEWTEAALAALNGEGVSLLSAMPADVLQYCPGYATQSRENRAAFWAGLLSAVARHESGLNPAAQDRSGRLGLLKISRPAAQENGCGGSMLKGEDNLKCAVRIMSRSVAQDGAIAEGKGGWRGVARNWMPLRSAQKRADIAGWTKQQSYCR